MNDIIYTEVIKIKIAILSDIHGNIVALKEVLKDAKKNNVDEYFVIGDMIFDLPFGDETLNIIKNITDVVLKGNKEQYIIEYDKEKYNWDNIQFVATRCMYNQLSRETIEYVKKLPHRIDLKRDGVKITLTHGSPKSVEEKINKNDEKIKQYYANTIDTDILFFGHTHEKMWMDKINNKLLINAGCLGVSPHYCGKAEYVILEIKDSKIENIEFKLVDYDIEKVKQMIIKNGILDYEKTYMNLTYLGINGNGKIRYQFFKDAEKMMLKKYGKAYRNDAKGIYTYFKLFDDEIWLYLSEKYKDYFVFL